MKTHNNFRLPFNKAFGADSSRGYYKKATPDESIVKIVLLFGDFYRYEARERSISFYINIPSGECLDSCKLDTSIEWIRFDKKVVVLSKLTACLPDYNSDGSLKCFEAFAFEILRKATVVDIRGNGTNWMYSINASKFLQGESCFKHTTKLKISLSNYDRVYNILDNYHIKNSLKILKMKGCYDDSHKPERDLSVKRTLKSLKTMKSLSDLSIHNALSSLSFNGLQWSRKVLDLINDITQLQRLKLKDSILDARLYFPQCDKIDFSNLVHLEELVLYIRVREKNEITEETLNLPNLKTLKVAESTSYNFFAGTPFNKRWVQNKTGRGIKSLSIRNYHAKFNDQCPFLAFESLEELCIEGGIGTETNLSEEIKIVLPPNVSILRVSDVRISFSNVKGRHYFDLSNCYKNLTRIDLIDCDISEFLSPDGKTLNTDTISKLMNEASFEKGLVFQINETNDPNIHKIQKSAKDFLFCDEKIGSFGNILIKEYLTSPHINDARNLKTINLSGCNVPVIPHFVYRLNNLENLIIHQAGLRCVDQRIFRIPKLKYLKLDYYHCFLCPGILALKKHGVDIHLEGFPIFYPMEAVLERKLLDLLKDHHMNHQYLYINPINVRFYLNFSTPGDQIFPIHFFEKDYDQKVQCIQQPSLLSHVLRLLRKANIQSEKSIMDNIPGEIKDLLLKRGDFCNGCDDFTILPSEPRCSALIDPTDECMPDTRSCSLSYGQFCTPSCMLSYIKKYRELTSKGANVFTTLY